MNIVPIGTKMKIKKNQNIAAVKKPKLNCAERIPMAVVFALSGSIGMIEKIILLCFRFSCWFFALFNSVQNSLKLI